MLQYGPTSGHRFVQLDKPGGPFVDGREAYPLYTHADPGEVEQGYSYEVVQALQSKIDSQRAQLAERDALLAEIAKRHWSGVDFDLPADLIARIKALSVSEAAR